MHKTHKERSSDFETEIRDHLELLTERYIRQGMAPPEARQAARRQFGNTTLLQEERREMQTIAAVDAFRRDLRYAARMLRRNSAFAGAVAASSFEGRPPLAVGVYNMAKYRPVSPGYFETIGIPLLRGRSFTTADSENALLVVMINESMARAWWGQENPAGKRLRFDKPVMRTIVGVVVDVLHEGLGLLGSAMLARLIAGLLYGVSALDPPIFVEVCLLLSTLALIASYIPARRATRVDPLAALRYE